MGHPRIVWLAALAAFLARFPSLLWPLRPDEAGFLLVARAWLPAPASLYGPYWVDRPPPMIWLMRATDAVGGPYAHRFLGAIGCSLLVLAAAAAARELVRRAAKDQPRIERVTAAWTAVVAAALVSNAQIDAVAAKGELLGIPLVMTACWLILRAVRRGRPSDAFMAGLVGVLAVGLKQSIVGGLVFGTVLLVGSVVAGQLSWRCGLRHAAAATAGVAIPVLGVISWSVASGVRLQTLFYVVVSFRSDASQILAAENAGAATSRASTLVLISVCTAMALLLLWFLLRLRDLVRQDAVATVAVTVMLVVDLAGVAASGSYWSPYLFVPMPGLALAFALLMHSDRVHPHTVRARLTPVIPLAVVVSSVASLAGWTSTWIHGAVPYEVRTGQAIAAAARPGDRVMVYGGRADLQWASGAQSPYPYLWSLPMRTLDPDLGELKQLLAGPEAPTWFVEAARLDTWSEIGTRPIERSLISKYEFVGTACGRYRVYHLNTVEPLQLDVDCDSPWRTIWND